MHSWLRTADPGRYRPAGRPGPASFPGAESGRALQGLKAMVARFLGRVRVVGEAADAETAERVVAALAPDVVT